MTENDSTEQAEIEQTTETPAGVENSTPEQPKDKPGLTDADREKLLGVVKKERGAAKEAATRAELAETQLAELKGAEARRAVAEELELTPEQAVLVNGDTPEEMAASAAALLAAFGPKADPLRTRPVERAPRTGATGRTEGVDDMSSVADRILD